MFCLNRVQLIGYQTQPVTVRQTPSGANVTDLNLVVPFRLKTDAGEELSLKSFHTVTLWGPMASVAGQFLKVGGQVFVAGRLQTDSWEDQETKEKRSKTKVIAIELILLDPKDGQMAEPEGSKQTLGALNRVDLIGNVTRDPEMRTLTSGQKILSLGVATNERWKDKTSGEAKERTEFHNVVVWGDLADEVSRVAKKGRKVFVSGRVQTRSWETQDGKKRYITEVVAETLSLLGARNPAAQESLNADQMPVSRRTNDESASAPAQDMDEIPAVAAIPEIQYESEVKVEDLPF